jgi:DNA-binding PadR family transcriptional regulator
MSSIVNVDIKSDEIIIGLEQTVEEKKNLVKNLGPSRTWKITFADLQLLSLLASLPMTGYALRKSFIESFGVKISFGTLYPRLRTYEILEMVKSTKINRPPRAPVIEYELTGKGKVNLEIALRTYREILKTIDKLAENLFSTGV